MTLRASSNATTPPVASSGSRRRLLHSLLVALLAAAVYGALVGAVVFNKPENLKVPKQSDIAVGRAAKPGSKATCATQALSSAVLPDKIGRGPGRYLLTTDPISTSIDQQKTSASPFTAQVCSYFVTFRGPLAATIVGTKPVLNDAQVVAIKGDAASGIEATIVTGAEGGFTWSVPAKALHVSDSKTEVFKAPLAFRFADLHGPDFDPYLTYGGLIQGNLEFTDPGMTTTLPVSRSGWKTGKVAANGTVSTDKKIVTWEANPAKYQVRLTDKTPPSQWSQVGTAGWFGFGSALVVFAAMFFAHFKFSNRYRRQH